MRSVGEYIKFKSNDKTYIAPIYEVVNSIRQGEQFYWVLLGDSYCVYSTSCIELTESERLWAILRGKDHAEQCQ